MVSTMLKLSLTLMLVCAWESQDAKLLKMPQTSLFLTITLTQSTELPNGEETFLTTSESSSNSNL